MCQYLLFYVFVFKDLLESRANPIDTVYKTRVPDIMINSYVISTFVDDCVPTDQISSIMYIHNLSKSVNSVLRPVDNSA